MLRSITASLRKYSIHYFILYQYHLLLENNAKYDIKQKGPA